MGLFPVEIMGLFPVENPGLFHVENLGLFPVERLGLFLYVVEPGFIPCRESLGLFSVCGRAWVYSM